MWHELCFLGRMDRFDKLHGKVCSLASTSDKKYHPRVSIQVLDNFEALACGRHQEQRTNSFSVIPISSGKYAVVFVLPRMG